MKPKTFGKHFSAGALCLCSFALVTASAADVKAEATYLTAARMIDPERGRIIENAAVVIQGGKITASGAQGQVTAPIDAKRIDLGSKTILPGLIDMHTHVTMHSERKGLKGVRYPSERPVIWAVGHLEDTLMAGFTTIRNLGDVSYSSVSLRDAIKEGDIVGPRMFDSGPPIGILGGYCSDYNMLPHQYNRVREVGVGNGPWEVRARARNHIKYGVDIIKTCSTGGVLNQSPPQQTMEELTALADEAHSRGYKLAIHAIGAEGVKNAIRAGADTVEHAFFIDDEGVSLAKKNGVYLAMNLYSSEYMIDQAVREIAPAKYLQDLRIANEAVDEGFRKAHRAGVKIVYATDAGNYPHGRNAIQFKRMVNLGMTPMQAIRSATTLAAEALGKQDYLGCISTDCSADIIAVEGNPLDNIALLESIDFVMKEGAVYKSE